MGGLSRRELLIATAALTACGGGSACPVVLSAGDLDEGIRLGARYLRTSRRGGDFVYEIDWKRDTWTSDPDGVRQAGATFGITDHAARTRAPEDLEISDAALGTWFGRRRITAIGDTFTWPRKDSRLGTTALLGLGAHARQQGGTVELAGIPLRELVAGISRFVRGSRLPEGGFADDYAVNTDTRGVARQPYSDGEALLFLSTVARTDPALAPELADWAEADWRHNVEAALAADPDSATTKGYYQWASMSWANLVALGITPDVWGRRLTDLAVWMVDVHRTLDRTRNTAYAYEGLVPAYAEAKRRGDGPLADKLACTIHQGLAKLSSWQIGHPRALPGLAEAPEKALGGVQNHATETTLRIDVTQHQLHALWLAKDSGVVGHFG